MGFGDGLDLQLGYYIDMEAELGRCCLARELLAYSGQTTENGGTTLRPDLAEALPEVSADGLAWTFHLKRGIHYAPPLADVEVTAGDFVRSLERELSAVPPYLQPGVWAGTTTMAVLANFRLLDVIEGARDYNDRKASSIAGVETPDPYTLRIHLTSPTGDLGYWLAPIDPIPPKPGDPEARFGLAEGHDGDYGYFMASVGPYMIEGADRIDHSLPSAEQAIPKGVRPDSLTLVRNPSWDRSTDHLRTASVDRIVITPVDEAHAEGAVERGDVDMVLGRIVPPGVYRHYRTSPRLRGRTISGSIDDILHLWMNVAVPPFDDLHVRRAVNFAVDKAAVLAAFQRTRGQTATVATHIAPDSEENNILLNYDPYAGTPSERVKAARDEMKKSRYDRNHDGACDAPICSDIKLPIPDYYAPERGVIARIVARSVVPLGIRVHPDVLGADRYDEALNDPMGALGLFETAKDVPSASEYLFQAVGGSAQAPQCCNFSHVGASPAFLRRFGLPVRSVPSVDDQIRACDARLFEAQVQCFADLDQYLMTEVAPAVPLVNVTGASIVSGRVARFSIDQAVPPPTNALDQVVLTQDSARESAPPETPPWPKVTKASSIPDGTYRVTVATQDFRRLGISENDAGESTGKFTLTLADGHWRRTQVNPDQFLFHPIAAGLYFGSGHRVTFATQIPPTNALSVTLDWHMHGDALRFHVIRPGAPEPLPPQDFRFLRTIFRALYESHPWKRVP